MAALLLVTFSGLLAGCECQTLVRPLRSRGPEPGSTRGNEREACLALLRSFARAARPHRIETLSSLLSGRLADSLPRTLTRHRQRFWRHVDWMVAGVESGLTVGRLTPRPDGRLDLPVSFTNGGSATLILVREGDELRLDRL